ncbi:MAG: 50S ribosomal protein L25 [Trueperaceae bacterium]|nr:50S ribosomal protein L25 [Trueperaceae bacterium]
MELAAQKRETGKANNLRKQGFIPAVVYNKGLNLSISVERRAFDKVFRSQGTSSIIDLKLDNNEEHAVLVKAVQMDKRRREPQHVDFYAITQGQVVQVNIPIELTGKAKGVKDSGGLLDVQKREVTISILPRLIPNHVEIDISELGMHDSLHVKDLVANLPAEAEVLDDLEATIVTVVAPRVVSEETVEEETAEPEVIAKGKEEDEEE